MRNGLCLSFGSSWLVVVAILLAPLPCISQTDHDFSRIDRHARKAPAEVAQNLTALTRYLVAKAKNDFEKARAIYSWITGNIAYDQAAAGRDKARINRSNTDILRRKRAICFGYSALFKAMCAEAGLRAVLVDGYSKGTLTATPSLEEPDHAWNAVRLEGRWYLLDATWGASVRQGNAFVADAGNEYFLASPARFIQSHLPAMPMWQLLPCPVPPEVFRRSTGAIAQYLGKVDSCFAWPDRIAAWDRLGIEEKRLAKARAIHRFNPTAATRNELGQAWMDWAGHLSERVESVDQHGEPAAAIALRDSVLRACEQADRLADRLYDWQKELWIGALINQAVARYNWSGSVSDPQGQLQQAERHLEKAIDLSAGLPPNSIYGQQARSRAKAYLTTVRAGLSKE